MHGKGKYIVLLVGVIALVLNFVSYAQEHDHSAHGNQPKSDAARAEETDVFCPTMKTGQLCSNGTTNIFRLTGANRDKWMTFTRKYNKAVDAATLELFKDAETMLAPAQLAQLKAWFAVGLNPQINQILNDKGLGAKK